MLEMTDMTTLTDEDIENYFDPNMTPIRVPVDPEYMERAFFEACRMNCQEATRDSIRNLFGYLMTETDQSRHRTIRKSLRLCRNRKEVIQCCSDVLESYTEPDQQLELLSVGVELCRRKFLYRFLEQQKLVNGFIPTPVIRSLIRDTPFDSEESDDVLKYVQDYEDYNYLLIHNMEEPQRKTAIVLVMDYINRNGVNEHLLRLLASEEPSRLLFDLEHEVVNFVNEAPLERGYLLSYIRVDEVIVQNLLNQWFMVTVFGLCPYFMEYFLKMEVWDERVGVLQSLYAGKPLSADSLTLVRTALENYADRYIDRKYGIYPSYNIIPAPFYAMIHALNETHPDAVQDIYTHFYNKGGKTSLRLLSEMARVRHPLAFSALISRMKRYDDDHKLTCLNILLTYYPDRKEELRTQLEKEGRPADIRCLDNLLATHGEYTMAAIPKTGIASAMELLSYGKRDTKACSAKLSAG